MDGGPNRRNKASFSNIVCGRDFGVDVAKNVVCYELVHTLTKA